jgi:transposase-like protein
MASEQDSKPPSAKEQFWRDLVQQWQRSGQTVRAFCAEHGLTEASFYAWRRIITQRDRPAEQPADHALAAGPRPIAPDNEPFPTRNETPDHRPAFVPIRVTPPPPRATPLRPTSGLLELVIGSGRVVRVPSGFDAATLRHLLAVLEETSPC